VNAGISNRGDGTGLSHRGVVDGGIGAGSAGTDRGTSFGGGGREGAGMGSASGITSTAFESPTKRRAPTTKSSEHSQLIEKANLEVSETVTINLIDDKVTEVTILNLTDDTFNQDSNEEKVITGNKDDQDKDGNPWP
jgi:hypothetical protein